MKMRERLPYKRVGHCCGPCGLLHDQVLYRVGDQFRYRCRECFKLETGTYP